MDRLAEKAALRDPQNIPAAYENLLDAPPEAVTPLTGRLDADCVVIGAGITGCSAALHLAEAGHAVVQLEAGVSACGGSGRAFGTVVPYGKHSEASVLKRFGARQGEVHITALAQGPALVRNLIQRHAMKNVIHGETWVLAPHVEAAIDTLRRRAEFWQARGADVEFLTGTDVEAALGSTRYKAGLKDNRAFAISPYAFTRGLARAARDAGVRQFTQTPALNLQEKGGHWQVKTPRGRVNAKTVLVCTNAYSGDLSPPLRRAFVRVRGYQAVTEPISEDLFSKVLPGTGVITDTRHTWSGIKKLPGNRLHLSAGGAPLSGTASADLRSVATRLREVYPDVGNINWQSQWSGWVALTPDQFPRICRLGDGVFAGFGYSGRGLACATLMGRELAQLATGVDRYEPFVPVEDIKSLPFHALGRHVAATIIHWYRLNDWLALRRG